MGCTLNENDSEKISGMATEMGYTQTENINEADLIIFNTCCIRENAEEKLFGKLGEVKKLKQERGTIIALCGCMMQEEHIVEKIKQSYRYVDIVFGTHTIQKFPEDLYDLLSKENKVIDILDIDGEVYEGLPIKRESKNKALVTIMYGCNNFCTYCIVPYVRGRERNRRPEDILREITSLAEEGYKEVVLLGQNVNSYKGNGYNGINNFADLLRAVNKINGIEIISFISPHPKDFTDDVIMAIKDCNKISRILHLPLQSGSSEVLKRMNRKYTKEQYLNLANKIKREIPDVVLSTDIIVGFPGEAETDFEDTLDVVKQVGFEQVFMFIYSKRVGTPAEKMENQIPENIKHERFDRLKELVENQMQENNKKYIGTVQNILIEGKSKTNENMLTGRTNTNKVVVLEGKEELIGKIAKVKIVSEHMWYLKGEIA
ncbi:MAG: tRNA (N6-isopentenyl adenosine(37)-C2)-methylthiotransferase MiaB [Clostridia bacterium]|nr:tRNA (N6-isopentenyl adenosine(37)-C2)-methylthiotransferase MiaB [Clostridia bacterium]